MGKYLSIDQKNEFLVYIELALGAMNIFFDQIPPPFFLSNFNKDLIFTRALILEL